MSLSRKLAFLLLGLSSCSSSPTLVSLGEVPTQATTLELRPLVAGQAGAAVRAALGALPATKRTLRVELGGALLGVPLFAQVFDDKACLLGYGQAEAGQALTLTAVSGCPNHSLRGPLLDTATPTRIAAEQPTKVTLRGAGLLPGVVVKAGGQALPLTWRSPLEVEVTAPASPGGLGKSLTLTASFEGQEAALAAPLRYFEARVTLDAPLLLNDPAKDGGGSSLLSGDINGDGLPDLLWGTGAFLILRNDTGADHVARFTRLPDLPSSAMVADKRLDAVYFPTLADVNGDGALDLIYTAFTYAANVATNAVVVVRGERPLRTNGNGFQAAGRVVFTRQGSIQALPADVDGDGDLDLILVTFGATSSDPFGAQVLLNKDGEFTPARGAAVEASSSCTLPSSGPTRALAADLDGDGRSELLFSSTSYLHTVLRFTDLSLCPERTDFTIASVLFNALGDWSGSGSLGFVSLFAGASIFLLPGDGRGGFALRDVLRQPLSAPLLGAGRTRLADLNGDGRDDLLIFSGDAVAFQYQLALTHSAGGSRPFDGPTQVLALPYDKQSNVRGASIQVADMDGDGRPDVITGSDSAGAHGPIYLYRNLPTP